MSLTDLVADLLNETTPVDVDGVSQGDRGMPCPVNDSGDPIQADARGKRGAPRSIWSEQVCLSLISRYPDDVELWDSCWSHIAKELDAGATSEWALACAEKLEEVWLGRRGGEGGGGSKSLGLQVG